MVLATSGVRVRLRHPEEQVRVLMPGVRFAVLEEPWSRPRVEAPAVPIEVRR